MRSNLLAPDTLAADQFAAVFRGSRELPEKRLFVAVLTNAILEFQERIDSLRKEDEWALEELVAWFFSRDRSWPFSFENLCDYLDLSPDWIRRRLSALLRRRRARAAERAS